MLRACAEVQQAIETTKWHKVKAAALAAGISTETGEEVLAQAKTLLAECSLLLSATQGTETGQGGVYAGGVATQHSRLLRAAQGPQPDNCAVTEAIDTLMASGQKEGAFALAKIRCFLAAVRELASALLESAHYPNAIKAHLKKADQALWCAR